MLIIINNMSIISQQLRLAEDYQPALTSFWQRGHFEHFIGCDNIRIEYAKFQHTQPHPCIVIVPGRVESYLKYQELCFDLYQQGFDIFIIDHRGQGLSQRILTDKNKGYVESFDCYRQDLDNFINNIICPNYPQAPYLLAHSMGGIIAADYLTIKPESVKAAILSSPMIAINTGKIPYILAQPIIKFTDIINKTLSNTPWYFLGQKTFKPTSFRKNTLMHSEKRYQVFSQLYQKTPNIQLGGVTIHWLIMAFKAEKQLLLADIGHYESEQFTKNLLVEYLTKKFTNFAIILSEKSTNPIYYI